MISHGSNFDSAIALTKLLLCIVCRISIFQRTCILLYKMNSFISTVEYRPQQNGLEQGNSESGEDVKGKVVSHVTTVDHIPSPTPLPAKVLHPNPKAMGSYKMKRVFKVIIIGDAGVGKTCLSYRFCNGRFPGATEATIGVDFRERSIVIDDELIRVQLWDTAGQERYRQSIVAHYYRNVNAVVFVYDVNNMQTFKSLPVWIAECRKHALTSGEDTPHILIGNKCDLNPNASAERVKTDQAQIFADECDMALFETSALADSEADHVESIFLTLVHKLRQSKAMHVQSTEERSNRERQKILLKANEVAKLDEEEGGGMCC